MRRVVIPIFIIATIAFVTSLSALALDSSDEIPVHNIGEINREDDANSHPCGSLINVRNLGSHLANPYCYNYILISAPPGSLVSAWDRLSNYVHEGYSYAEIRNRKCVGCGIEEVDSNGTYNMIFNRGYAMLEVLTPDGELISSGEFYVPAATLSGLKWIIE